MLRADQRGVAVVVRVAVEVLEALLAGQLVAAPPAVARVGEWGVDRRSVSLAGDELGLNAGQRCRALRGFHET